MGKCLFCLLFRCICLIFLSEHVNLDIAPEGSPIDLNIEEFIDALNRSISAFPNIYFLRVGLAYLGASWQSHDLCFLFFEASYFA